MANFDVKGILTIERITANKDLYLAKSNKYQEMNH